MPKNKAEILLGIVVGFLLGVLSGALWINWQFVSTGFFQVRITEIAQILVTLTVAVFITFLIKNKTDKQFKRREVLHDLLAKLDVNLDELSNLAHSYMSKKVKEDEIRIRRKLKLVSQLLSATSSMLRDEEVVDFAQLELKAKEQFFALKEALTDSPFADSKGTYSETQISKFQNHYEAFFQIICQMKLAIYK